MAADAKTTQARTATHWQRFSVPYEYPVVFTEGVFDPDNPALREVLCRLEPAKRHRVVFFVDDGLLAGRAQLLEKIPAEVRKRIEKAIAQSVLSA